MKSIFLFLLAGVCGLGGIHAQAPAGASTKQILGIPLRPEATAAEIDGMAKVIAKPFFTLQPKMAPAEIKKALPEFQPGKPSLDPLIVDGDALFSSVNVSVGTILHQATMSAPLARKSVAEQTITTMLKAYGVPSKIVLKGKGDEDANPLGLIWIKDDNAVCLLFFKAKLTPRYSATIEVAPWSFLKNTVSPGTVSDFPTNFKDTLSPWLKSLPLPE
jgi:hypothetical protein